RPEVVSFHFGLPEPRLLERLKAGSFLLMSSATTAAEARWLEERGVDAIIAQGFEAGGHRGVFLTEDAAAALAYQAGTLALAPLRAKAEAQGSGDFSPLWAGQAAALGRALPAGELTRTLAAEALERMRLMGRSAGTA